MHQIKRTIRPWYHGLVSYLGACRFLFPSKKMRVVGVTGTKGKSTVIQMIVSIARTAGWTVGYSSSIGFSDGKTDQNNSLRNSMPGRFRLHRLMAQAKRNGAQLFVVESTSEGLAQNRHKGIHYDIGVFTNLYPEHIQSHGSFEAYKKAKSLLFTSVAKNSSKNLQTEIIHSHNVLNGEGDYASYYAECGAVPAIYVGLNDNNWDIRAHIQSQQKTGTTFEVHSPNIAETPQITLPVTGDFNVINALLAIGVARQLQLEISPIVQGLEQLSVVPGRMEIVAHQPLVIVDYAHIPEALEAVYSELHERWKTSDNKLIAVLGSCGGGRDTWKREPMGQVAGEYADY
ncbi:MAG: Mur ligase family protein, partial [Candidatus Paceibacteria bacterium]